MSDPRVSEASGCQYTSLIFSNQKCKEPDNNRDFSPEFQTARQETKSEHRSDDFKRNKTMIKTLNLNLSSKNDLDQKEKAANDRKAKLDREGKGKRPDRNTRANKSEHNKPLAFSDSNADPSKQNLTKGIKCTILTPKYRQINLKRNGFIGISENSIHDGKIRDKSANYTKKGKLCIEISKINSVNKTRGVSADDVITEPSNIDNQKVQSTTKQKKISKNRIPKNLRIKLLRTPKKFSGKDNNYSHRVKQSSSLVDTVDKDNKKARVETKSVKPFKLTFPKDSEHKQLKINGIECIDAKSMDDCVNATNLNIEDNQNMRICTGPKSSPKNEEFLPDFGCNKDSALCEIVKVRHEEIRSEKDSDKNKLTYSCKAMRSNSKRSSFEIKLSK